MSAAAEAPAQGPRPSVNHLAAPLVARLLADATALRIGVSRPPPGHALVDAGIDHVGGIEAGLRIAEICLGGLGRVALVPGALLPDWPWTLSVHCNDPVLACLGSQYAGWSLSHGSGDETFHSLGSGPGRALAAREPLFAELGYHDEAGTAVLVLETDKIPPRPLIEKILTECAIEPGGLTVVLTPTRSLAGTVQVAARALEVALHKLHELGFPLERVIDGMGAAPLPPPAPELVAAMGRTNDAIIFGGSVQLFVTGPDDEARDLAERLPSSRSPDYGKPFAEILKDADGDFYGIDPLLFSAALVTVTALDSGRSFIAGRLDPERLARAFGASAAS